MMQQWWQWLRQNAIFESRGDQDGGKPILLNRDGLVDPSMLDLSDYVLDSDLTTTLSDYALLAGRSGGQTLYGGTGSGDNLTLESTSHATKGTVIISGKMRVGDGFMRIPFSDFGVSASGTLTISVTSTLGNRRSFMTDITAMCAVGGGSNDRAGLRSLVHWQCPQTAGNNASVRQTDEPINNTTNATIVGPTAIANGYNYVLTNNSAFSWGSTMNHVSVAVYGRGAAAVSVSAVVA